MKRFINFILFAAVGYLSIFAQAFAEVKWDIISADPMWLPTFWTKKEVINWLIQFDRKNSHWFLVKAISEGIKYVWLLAVLSLTIWWIMYMTSYWTDDKTKKAKNVILYSIIWVVISIGAFALVEIVNNINLN